VREDHVAHRDGEESTFGVVVMKPGVSVLPMDENGEVTLVREFKYAVGEATLEVVSGALESGESPETAALRELSEECGLTAAEWIDMGVLNPFTTIVNSPNHMFLARGLLKARRLPEASERIEVVRMPFDDALYAVLRGEITHGASCALILKTKFFLERGTKAKAKGKKR
jgi:ADP-ribose pyrophosphatase